MRFGGRLQAAIEVLGDIGTRHRPVADALKDWGLSHRFAGSGDRAAIGNLVYDALRWRASSAWRAASEEPRDVILAMVLAHWGVTPEALVERLDGDRFAPELPAIDALAAMAARDLADAPDHIRADVPDWIAPMMADAFGEAWVEEGVAAAGRPPFDMRVNTLKADRAKVAKALASFGVVATPHAGEGLRVPPTTGDGRHPNLTVDPAFQKGWFDVQDEGSQLAATMAGAAPGEQVLDLCAGAGGKTLALAAAMGNKGQLFATDADRTRLAPIFERTKRAGTRNVQIRPAGASLDDLAGRLDLVLIDAPCTGTGTWRRRPDTKWRLKPEAVELRTGEQDGLLAQAAGLVKPGGRIVYVTCSFLPAENTARVAAFLTGRDDFAALPPDDLLATAGLAPATAYGHATGVQLSPGRTGTDAFFVAGLRKTA